MGGGGGEESMVKLHHHCLRIYVHMKIGSYLQLVSALQWLNQNSLPSVSPCETS